MDELLRIAKEAMGGAEEAEEEPHVWLAPPPPAGWLSELFSFAACANLEVA